MLQPATHACRRAGGFRCQIACAAARLQVARLQHQCSTLSCHLRISCRTMYLLAFCLIFSADGVFSKAYVTSSNLYKSLLYAPDALPKHGSSECRHACRHFSNVGVSVVLGRSIVFVLRRTHRQTETLLGCNCLGFTLSSAASVITTYKERDPANRHKHVRHDIYHVRWRW